MNNMKRLMLLTFISMALASLTAGAQTKNAALGNADSTQEIRAWLDRWTKAFTKQDVDTIMALYTDDVVAYDIVPPLQYIGKAAYRADYQQFFRSTKAICTSKSAICTLAPPGTSVMLPGWN